MNSIHQLLRQLIAMIANLSSQLLIGGVSLLGIMVAWRIAYIQQGWITDDSVLYFESARLIALGEWQAAFALYEWPLYPLLIAQIHLLTDLSLHLSAQLLSIILFGLTVFSFATLIHMAGGSRRALLFGALLLFGSPYIAGDILEMLLRDHGFWSFYLLSLIFIIRYFQHHHARDAMLWQISISLATLFRIEAMSFLMLLPAMMVLFSDKSPWKQRLFHFLHCNSVFIAMLAIAILTWLIWPPALQNIELGRLNEPIEIVTKIYSSFIATFEIKAAAIKTHVLPDFSMFYAGAGLTLTLLLILLGKTMSTTGWVSVLLLMARGRRVFMSLDQPVKQLLISACFVAILNMIGIFATVWLLSGRYAIALAFPLMILAALCLADISRDRSVKSSKFIALASVIVSSIILFNNLSPKPDTHNIEKQAVDFVLTQNVAVDEIFFVEPRSRFYAGAAFAGRGYDTWSYTKESVEKGLVDQYRLLLLKIDSRSPEQLAFLQQHLQGFEIIQTFEGYKGREQFLVFRNNLIRPGNPSGDIDTGEKYHPT